MVNNRHEHVRIAHSLASVLASTGGIANCIYFALFFFNKAIGKPVRNLKLAVAFQKLKEKHNVELKQLAVVICVDDILTCVHDKATAIRKRFDELRQPEDFRLEQLQLSPMDLESVHLLRRRD